MRENYDCRRHAGERIAQGGAAHQAQGLDVDELAAAVEIEEPAGPVLASLIRVRIAAGTPARRPRPFNHQRNWGDLLPRSPRCNTPVTVIMPFDHQDQRNPADRP